MLNLVIHKVDFKELMRLTVTDYIASNTRMINE